MTTSRSRPMVARRVLAAALGVVTSGCSFVSVQRARPLRELDDPRVVVDTCTTSKRAPIADTVIAGAGYLAGVVAMAAVAERENADGQGYWIVAVPFWSVGGLFTGSAIYGYATTGRCRRRIAAGGRCADGDLDACQRLKPGWEPPPGWRAAPTLEPRPAVEAPGPSSPGWTSEPSQPGAASDHGPR